jgi:glycine hydroxymethyltransferase
MHSLDRINRIVQDHHRYRENSLNLIASECIISPTVRRYLNTDFVCRYGNYNDDPAVRGFKGNKYIIEIESEAHKLAKELFHAKYIDLRPLSGETADNGVIMALTRQGDTVFETGESYGGHMAATRFVAPMFNMPPSLTNGLYNIIYWPYDIKTHQIDIEKSSKLIREKKPSLLIIGRAQVLFSPEPVKEIKEIAEEVGAYLGYDASHVFGLMAGKRFFNPLDDGADVIFGSHTKSFPGPQGGMALTNSEEMYTKLQGGKGGRFCGALVCNHHIHRVAAFAAALAEMKEFGEAYADQIVRNSAVLGKAMYDLGFNVLYPEYGFSRTHMIILDVNEFGGGPNNANLLEKANIFCSSQSIPIDDVRGTGSSGLRIGTQELSRTGMKEKDMNEVAELIKRVVIDKEDAEVVAKDVAKFVNNFNRLTFSFDDGLNPYKVPF